MVEAQLEQQKKKLVKVGIMAEEEILIDSTQANYVAQVLGKYGPWKLGWAYFTEERLIIVTGFFSENIFIPYVKIRELEKCSQGLLPTGIVINHENVQTGELESLKLSLIKRDKWMELMREKAGL